MTISELFSKTDWALLKQQKLMLLESCITRPELEGLVNWIDDLQEIAEQQGYPVQWLSEDNDNQCVEG